MSIRVSGDDVLAVLRTFDEPVGVIDIARRFDPGAGNTSPVYRQIQRRMVTLTSFGMADAVATSRSGRLKYIAREASE